MNDNATPWNSMDDEQPEPERLFRPSLKRLQPAHIPTYVRDWLARTADEMKQGEKPSAVAARVLTEACHTYYRLHAPPLPFKLVEAFAIAANAEEGPTLEWLAEIVKGDPDDGVSDLILEPCITNGAYAWFFSLATRRTDFEAFEAWVCDEWRIEMGVLKKSGWPDKLVVRVQDGTWPRDPRLQPGNPITQQSSNDMLRDHHKPRVVIP